MQKDNLICGLLKVRNEIVQSGNLYRCLANAEQYCSDIYAIDDASWDGTREYLISRLGEDHVLCVSPEKHDFSQELFHKQDLLKLVHQNGPWEYLFWFDTDEILDAKGTKELRDFARQNLNSPVKAWSFHYTQLWRNASWARTDASFDEGNFIKLWRYSPDLTYHLLPGTHQPQFPVQVAEALSRGQVKPSPFDTIHYGNYGVNLRWKCIKYFGGLGGVDRHLLFDGATYREVPDILFPEGADKIKGEKPIPFTSEQVNRIRELRNLKNLEETFCIIVPTRNRGYSLPAALDSLLAQTYTKWICFVLDDGSADNTEEIMWQYQERDPRFFYCRYLEQRGGVVMNEVGCEIACQTASWWTRLGSDDVFFPKKLERDAEALRQYPATYGAFQASRKGVLMEYGNTPVPSDMILPGFLKGGFFAGWANVAVRTEVLQEIKKKFGTYCDPNLINMEDRLMNFRIAKVVPFVWRGVYDGQFIINPDFEQCKKITQDVSKLESEAYWNCNEVDGASANYSIYGRDSVVTTQIIEREKGL